MLTAVSGVECHGQASSWAPPLFQANEALAQDTETAVVWQESGPPGAPGSAMQLSNSVTLGKALGKEERKLASTDCNAVLHMSSSPQFIQEGVVPILHGRTLKICEGNDSHSSGKMELGHRAPKLIVGSKPLPSHSLGPEELQPPSIWEWSHLTFAPPPNPVCRFRPQEVPPRESIGTLVFSLPLPPGLLQTLEGRSLFYLPDFGWRADISECSQGKGTLRPAPDPHGPGQL